jgi:hypothetical protein
MRNKKDCLAAALTLLVKHGILDLEKIITESKKGGHESLFEYLNSVYKESFGDGE